GRPRRRRGGVPGTWPAAPRSAPRRSASPRGNGDRTRRGRKSRRRTARSLALPLRQVAVEDAREVPDPGLLVGRERDPGTLAGPDAALHAGQVGHVLVEDRAQGAELGGLGPVR